MTAGRPSKPWRVIVAGSEITSFVSMHTSEDKAYTFAKATLSPDSPADITRIEHWEEGHWRWFETLRNEDMP